MSNFSLKKDDKKSIGLTEDDISLILDCLYETAAYQLDVYYNKSYSKAVMKIAKKIDKLWR